MSLQSVGTTLTNTQPIINIKSSQTLFSMKIGMTVGRWKFGSYEKAYRYWVAAEAKDPPTSIADPLPEIAAVYLLAQAGLRDLITIKGRKVNLKMDSVIDYKGRTANVCIETLQSMLFDHRDEAEQSTLYLDQLRVYPAIVNKHLMQRLQSCYLEYAGEIVQRVERICAQHRIKLPVPSMNYDPMNPKHVAGWLEKVLLENRTSPQYIEAAVKAMSAIGDLETSVAKQWVDLCLNDYLQYFEKQTINETTQSFGVAISDRTSQNQSGETARKQLDKLLQEIVQRKQNQSITLEVRQRVSC